MEPNELLIGLIFGVVLIISFLLMQPLKAKNEGKHIGDDLANLIMESQNLFNQGKYNEALDATDELNSRFSWYTKHIYSIRAMSLEKLGFYLDSIDDYSNAIKIQSNDANIYFLRGLVYYKLGHYDEAISDFKSASTLEPETDEYANYLKLVTETANPELERATRERAILKGMLKRREKDSSPY
jgi:tetratricopeptide (TPR) repeat protein